MTSVKIKMAQVSPLCLTSIELPRNLRKVQVSVKVAALNIKAPAVSVTLQLSASVVKAPLETKDNPAIRILERSLKRSLFDSSIPSSKT